MLTDKSEPSLNFGCAQKYFTHMSDSSLSSSYCPITPQLGQGWSEDKRMLSKSDVSVGIGIIENAKKFIEMKRRSPRKHPGSAKRDKQEIHKIESVLVSTGKADGGKQQWQQEAEGNLPPAGTIKETLQFDDSEWNVLSKGYLPSNKTVKRDHAVAYLGPGASEEEIQNEFTKMTNLHNQLVSFGNRAVRRIMLDNSFKSKLTREHNGNQLALSFDDVKNRWKNWDMEKELELAEIYYHNIVGWFDVNKTWLEKSEKEFLSNKHCKWNENEEVNRMKGHKVKMNFIQERFSICKTNAVKEISRVSRNNTSHGYYVNGTADRDKVSATYRKKPGEFNLAYLHSWNKNRKQTAPPIPTHKTITQLALQISNTKERPPPPPPAPATKKKGGTNLKV